MARPRNLALGNSPEAPEGAEQTGLAAGVGAYIGAYSDEIARARTVISAGTLPVTIRGNPFFTVKVSPLTHNHTRAFQDGRQYAQVRDGTYEGSRQSGEEGLPAAASAGWGHDIDVAEVNVAVGALNKSCRWQRSVTLW